MNICVFIAEGVCVLGILKSLLTVKGIIDVFWLMDEVCHVTAVL